MSIRRWEPWDIDIFSDFEKLRREIDRMFEEFIPLRREREITFRPNIDLIETDNEVILKAELPGLKKDNIEITVTEDEVHLKGEKREEMETKKENYLRKEICYGKFERVISLPSEVDPEKVEAEFKDGILEIKMPKKEEAWFSGYGDRLNRTLETEVNLNEEAVLSFETWYRIENNSDYGHVEISSDGQNWSTVIPSFTGENEEWRQNNVVIPSNTKHIRFHYQTDATVNGRGWYVKNINLETAGGQTIETAFTGEGWLKRND